MATDTSFGEVRKFEDFLVTAIANIGEVDYIADGSGTTQIHDHATDGRLKITSGGNDGGGESAEVGAVSFEKVFTAGDGSIRMEARIFISTIADFHIFVGFGTSTAADDETSFSAASDTVTIDTMTDGIGFVWDGDQSTDQWWAVAGNTDSVTVNQGVGADHNPVATVPVTLGCYLSLDRKSAIWSIDGEEVYRKDSTSALVAAIDLAPGVWQYDQGTATDIDVDYLYAAKGRSST